MSKKVEYEFNPFKELGIDPPEKGKKKVLDAVGGYLVTAIIDYCGEQNSPVAGRGKFKKLSKDYAAYKKSQGKPPIPNLELFGDMLDALKFKVSGDSIILAIKGKQGDKADGHCNHSGESDLPERRFIPDDRETFKRPILDGVRSILKDKD